MRKRKQATKSKPFQHLTGLPPGDRILVAETLTTLYDECMKLFEQLRNDEISHEDAGNKLRQLRAAGRLIDEQNKRDRTAIKAAQIGLKLIAR